MTERFDAVVIGSGAGGAPVAFTLSKSGARVLVLEKGPRHQSKDFLHDEIDSCRRNFFTPFVEDDPHTLRRGQTEKATRTNAGWISQCVGGGTVHMSGFFFRFHPIDFALKRTFGAPAGSTVIDWPFDYDTLAPYYDRVEREVGVSGDVVKNPHEPPRNGPFPYPPVAAHPVSAWIDQKGAELGMHPYPVPRAIITAAKEGRGACVYHALCGSYGCEVGAKSSTLAALIPPAEATGRCEVRPRSMVQRILLSKNGRARGVEYIDEAGQVQTVDAELVIVAASAIESARLLLLSASATHPNGLGNNGGQVGQNLTFSTLGAVEGELQYADFSSEQAEQLKSRAPFVSRAVQDFYRVEPEGALFGKGGTFHFLWEHANPIRAAERLIRDGGRLVYGAELQNRLVHHFKESRTMEIECFSEWLPTPGCNITLDEEVTDRWGLPSAQITVERHPSDHAASQLLVDRATELLRAVGARTVKTTNVGGETWVLQHGTCRMGTDPANSVTNADGRLHEVENVYVSCGGSLPTSGAVPSTMTILANAFRIADGIVSRWKT